MIVYVFMLVVSALFVIRYDINKRTGGYWRAFFFLFCISVLVAGLRYKIGSDTLSYIKEYPYMPSLFQLPTYNFSDSRYNLFWILFCAVCKVFSDSFYFMQFVHVLVINILYFYFFYKSTKYRFSAILMYFLFGYLYLNTEILRESLAIGIFLLAMPAYQKRQWLKYYILSGLAIMFHVSALLVLFFPVFYKIKFNKFFIYSLVIIAILAGVIWQVFNDYVQLLYVVSAIESQATAYLSNEMYVFNLKGVLFGLLNGTVVPLLAVILYKLYVKEKLPESPFVWLYIAIGIFVVYNNTIFARFQNYLFFPFILFLAKLFNEMFRNRRKILLYQSKVTFLFLGLLVGKYYNFLKPDITETTYIYQRYIPYYSVVSMRTTPERELLDYYW